MTERVYLSRSISLSQGDQGFNYRVEAGFILPIERKSVRTALNTVLREIDHVALGIDRDLGFPPTTARICLWIAEKLRTQLKIHSVDVVLRRGDGVCAEVRT